MQGISKQNRPTEKELAIEAGRKGLSEKQLNTLSTRADQTGTTLDELLAARGSEHLYEATDSRFNTDESFDIGGSRILLAEQKYTLEERSLSLVDKFGSMLPSIPQASEDSFGGYMWNRVLDGTVRDQLFGIVHSFNNWEGAVVGVTVGGNVGFDWFTNAGASTTYAIDTNGDFIHVVTPEVGGQLKKSRGGFLRGVVGLNNTVEDLTGIGDSITIDYSKYSFSATLPRTVENQSYPGVTGSSIPVHSHTTLPILEFGYSTGKESNASYTWGYGATINKGNVWKD